MNQPRVYRYCGRDFTADEVEWIRQLVSQSRAKFSRRAVSRVVCEHLK